MEKTVRQARRLLTMVFLSIILFACGGDDDPLNVVSTRVRAIHLSPETSEVDVEYGWGGHRETFVGLTYRDATEYTKVRTWSTVTFKNPSGDEIADLDDPDFDNDTHNTVYLINPSGTLQVIQSEDSRGANTSKAKVRFVHACADAPAVDLKTDLASGTAVIADTAFKGIAGYILLDPGETTFVITETGDTVDALAVFEPVTLSANTIYTFVVLGTLDGKDAHEFGATIFDDTGSGSGSRDLTIAP